MIPSEVELCECCQAKVDAARKRYRIELLYTFARQSVVPDMFEHPRGEANRIERTYGFRRDLEEMGIDWRKPLEPQLP